MICKPKIKNITYCLDHSNSPFVLVLVHVVLVAFLDVPHATYVSVIAILIVSISTCSILTISPTARSVPALGPALVIVRMPSKVFVAIAPVPIAVFTLPLVVTAAWTAWTAFTIGADFTGVRVTASVCQRITTWIALDTVALGCAILLDHIPFRHNFASLKQ